MGTIIIMFEVLICDPSLRLASSKDSVKPDGPEFRWDLHASSSSSSSYTDLDSSTSSSAGLPSNISLDSSFKSTSSSATVSSHAAAPSPWMNSIFFKKKQAKAATKIQAVVRGFLVRSQILKAPILAELDDIERRRQEELERIEVGKRAEMEAIRAEFEREFDLLKESLSEAKELVSKLGNEKAKYQKENAELKLECKELKKANKELTKEDNKNKQDRLNAVVTLAVAHERITKLESHKAQRQVIADKYLQNISTYQERIREADEALQCECDHVWRLKACISGVLDLVEPKSENLTRKLLKIAQANRVFL